MYSLCWLQLFPIQQHVWQNVDNGFPITPETPTPVHYIYFSGLHPHVAVHPLPRQLAARVRAYTAWTRTSTSCGPRCSIYVGVSMMASRGEQPNATTSTGHRARSRGRWKVLMIVRSRGNAVRALARWCLTPAGHYARSRIDGRTRCG